MTSRIPILVDGRIFTLQEKGGISQFYAYMLASPLWRRHLETWLLVYPGYERNLHLQASGLLATDDVHMVCCSIPSSDHDRFNQPKHDQERAEVIRATGCCFSAVVNTYYGENVLPECERYIVTALDFAHEDLPVLTERPSTAGVLRRKRVAFEQATWVCFISNASRERFFVHYPSYDRQRTSVIYLGHEPRRPHAVRARNTVLHVGSRGLYKNFGVVAEALRRLMESKKAVRLLLLGGEPTDGVVEALQRDFPGRVIFDPNPTDAAMDLAMASSWVYVSASVYEGFGIPLLNAMRLGAHPVVSNIPVYREVAGSQGRYFNPSSADELHHELLRALACAPTARRIWRTWDDVAIEYSALLCDMNESHTGALLRLESDVVRQDVYECKDQRELFVSVNPDLKTDFGHYLNYEKRLAETCSRQGLGYVGLASRKLQVGHPDVVPVFERDSGYYALVRASAIGQEESIACEFRQAVLAAIDPLISSGRWARVHVFMYCGSSFLALRLAELDWPESINLCINAFWDFAKDATVPPELSRLRFQRVVHLLAMSDLHADSWFSVTGLHFNWIPNPPPLLNDRESYNLIRCQLGAARDHRQIRVFVPGLMTIGKGREATAALLEYLRQHGTQGRDYVFRDRSGELGVLPTDPVQVFTGDLSDEELIGLYRSSDVVFLPYEAPTFAERTSGALVDALVFGAVPLVQEGTWLACQCRKLGVGLVLTDVKPETLIAALAMVEADLEAELRRLWRAAALYVSNNTWLDLFRHVVRRPEVSLQPCGSASAKQFEASLFATANRMLRLGLYDEATQLYAWMWASMPLSVYQSNLLLCENRRGRRFEELKHLSTTL